MADTQPGFFRFIQSKAGSNSTFYPTTLSVQKSLKSGWLKKQGGVVKSWQRRWFTLKGDTLYCYSSEGEGKSPVGSVFLPGNKVVEVASAESEKFLFEIAPGQGKTQISGSHGTYQLCAATDEERKDWVKVIRKVMYAEKGGAIFGQAITETMMYERIRDPTKKVPTIVEMCIEYLQNNAMLIEGIFRLPGRSSFVRELKEMFDCGERPDFSTLQPDVHSVASLLKAYLRDLPESIIPVQFYDAVRKIVVRDFEQNPEEAFSRMFQLLSGIPADNYNLLHRLCVFLVEVASFSDVNKMIPMNLATVFAQSVIMPESDDPAILMGTANVRTRMVFVLISECKQIFKMEYNPLGSAVHVDDSLVDLAQNDTSPVEGCRSTADFHEDLVGLDWDVVSEPQEEPPEAACTEDDDDSAVESNTPEVPSEEPIYDNAAAVTDSSEDEPLYARVNNDRMKRNLSTKHRTAAVYSESSKTPPIPAPRTQRSIKNSVCSFDESPPEESTESLLAVSLDSVAEADLRGHTEALLTELKHQKEKHADLLSEFTDLHRKNAQNMNEMAKKLQVEKVSTTEAVNRIVQLQSELHQYQMKFGPLG